MRAGSRKLTFLGFNDHAGIREQYDQSKRRGYQKESDDRLPSRNIFSCGLAVLFQQPASAIRPGRDRRITGTKIVISTKNARKILSPRSSTQKGNSGVSIGLVVV